MVKEVGGRGASSGVSVKGKLYGTEYKSLLEYKNIKFVKYLGNEKTTKPSATPPMETMTKGRVYVTVNNENKLKSITFYDKNNLRYKQIDRIGKPHYVNGSPMIPHTHLGYWHDENGSRNVTVFERHFIELVRRIWDNRNK